MEPMRKMKVVAPSLPKWKIKPAKIPEERENQMIALAIDLAEQQLINGTASSQVITHYLKLGSSRERLEREILQVQKEHIEAKRDNIRSAAHSEEVYTKALEAMRRYSGYRDEEEDYETYLQ